MAQSTGVLRMAAQAWVISLLLLYCQGQQSTVAASGEDVYCRDSWFTNLSLSDFSQVTCAKCYVQTFFNKGDLTISFPPTIPLLLVSKTSNRSYVADQDQASICQDSLTAEECERWTQCCDAALHCCKVQLEGQLKQQEETKEKVGCPATWDGISCWPRTAPSIDQTTSCPAYYTPRALHWLQPVARKECDVDGRWAVHPVHGHEMSNFNDCFDTSTNISILKAALYIDLIGNSISIILLLLAIIIIGCSRTLRVELLGRDSVRIHFNLFFSMMFLGVCNVIMDAFFLREGLKQPEEAIAEVSSNVWCKVVHVLAGYFRSATYMCMFCEGLYLYKRISNVMKVGIQDSLTKYYIISWVLPAVTMATYCIVRFAVFNVTDSCVAEGEYYYLELIHIIPNLLSLACNLVFLISIEFMLCTKLRSDTNDRRVQVLRHALRATLSLIPIFGIQFLFIIYRPAFWPPYEILSALFTSTQGSLVAMLYCFSNKDVKEELRNLDPADYCCCSCLLDDGLGMNGGGRHRRRTGRGLSLMSQSTKTSRMSLPRYSVDLVQQAPGPGGRGGAKRVALKLPERSSLPDVISATPGKFRRDSGWSTVSANNGVRGSGRSLPESGRSLPESGRGLGLTINLGAELNRSSFSNSSSNHSSNNSSKRSSRCGDDLNRAAERPTSLEMIELFEPLMLTLASGGSGAQFSQAQDTSSLTDIEEEKTSQLSPIVEAHV